MKKDLLLLLFLILPAFSILLQPGYFSMHDDLQSLRQYQLDKCFVDGQIPCRWVPDLGYGYGYPLFNYYPPLPYLIGQPFRWLGLQYIDIVKVVGVIGFITAAAFMYLLGKEFWGKSGGLLSAVFYTYAPYHSVDYYVRGAVNEFWAMAIYPAIFYFTYRLIVTRRKIYLTLTALSAAALLLSHNPMFMIFAPLLLLWCLFWTLKLKSHLPTYFLLTLSALWAFGLAAFFTLPVVFEARYVSLWTLTSGYFNYLAHFLNLKQIFLDINWGYGSSQLGPNDTMSFALGFLHWLVPLLILLLTPFVKKLRQHKFLILLLVFFTLSSLFMSHSKSTEIWKVIRPLEFLQFPWRFLTLAVFSVSFLSGAITLAVNKKLFFVAVLLLLIYLNGNYFRPREWYPDMTDDIKFSGHSWQLLITSGIFDYLPIWAPQPPADPAGADINITHGSGTFSRLAKSSHSQSYQLNVTSPQASVELQTFYFPGWKVFLDGLAVSLDPSRDPLLGRMQIDVPIGSHTLTAHFTNTPVRTLGNLLSLISWLAIPLVALSNQFPSHLLRLFKKRSVSEQVAGYQGLA